MRSSKENKANRQLIIFAVAVGISTLVIATAHAFVRISPFQSIVLKIAAASSADCAVRLKNFVGALDRVLDENPSSSGPIKALLQTHFPMENCDIDDVFKISRQSKYFFSIDNLKNHYTVIFNNGGYFAGLGFQVGFGILKDSGNSSLPYALPNKERIVR